MPQTYRIGNRSIFVTTVAWFFIVLAGSAAALAVLRQAEMGAVMAGLAATGGVAPLLLPYLPWVMGAGVLLSLATAAAAVGLLLRLEWARRTLIALLLVALMANLAGLWLQHAVVQSVVDTALGRAALPHEAREVVGGFVTASRVLGTLMTLAVSALLGWVAMRLSSDSIRREFA